MTAHPSRSGAAVKARTSTDPGQSRATRPGQKARTAAAESHQLCDARPDVTGLLPREAQADVAALREDLAVLEARKKGAA